MKYLQGRDVNAAQAVAQPSLLSTGDGELVPAWPCRNASEPTIQSAGTGGVGAGGGVGGGVGGVGAGGEGGWPMFEWR